MSLAGKMTPLGVNTLNGLIQNTGLGINDTSAVFMGYSTGLNYTKGSIVNNSVQTHMVDCLSTGYSMISPPPAAPAEGEPAVDYWSQADYDSLSTIGASVIPALGCTKPTTYVGTYASADSQFGFMRVLALQAYNEIHYGSGSYSDLVSSFQACEGFKSMTNRVINSVTNSVGYLDGVYSTLNDLTTSDITGVNQSTLYWGQDLIKTGRAIDLKSISTFGNPINLLRTIQKNNAMTKALSLALLASGLGSTEIGNILMNVTPASVEQTKKIYGAFTVIQGNDLDEVLTPLNVQTLGLVSLADLLDPIKLFPVSYKSLTVPDYNTRPLPTNSKTYYPIYNNGAVNGSLPAYGNYLYGIVPENVALACVAFSASMQQIKNITKMDIEKFSQVVTHLENTSGLGAVGGASSPVDSAGSANTLSIIAKGSGPNGTYLTNDFFGAASGIPYKLESLYVLLNGISTLTLYTIYQQLKAALLASNYAVARAKIAEANAEITNIYNNDRVRATNLNEVWNNMGAQLTLEKAARAQVLQYTPQTSLPDIYSFVDSVNGYASDTGPGQAAQTLEKIADLTSIGGQSLVGMMREQRNAQRLGLAGGVLDNDIDDTSSTSAQNNLSIPIVSGDSIVPGSLAGSAAVGLVPANLDLFNISGSVTPTVITPDEALANIIICNCDCWNM